MDNFLENQFSKIVLIRYSLHRKIAQKKQKKLSKNNPPRKHQAQMIFTGKFYQKFREELTIILLKLPKNYRGRNTPKIILCGHHHIDNKTRQRYPQKENYSPISLMNIDAKILSKILSNQIQQNTKGSFSRIKRDLFQRCKDFSISV